jgi:cysteine desulfurase
MLRLWDRPGNASSPHVGGAVAAAAIASARAGIAELIGAAAEEIVFTSGATEANNLAILGAARHAVAAGMTRRRIIVSAVEHKSVLEPTLVLASEGFDVIEAPVDATGVIDLQSLRALLDEQTLLVSVMAANNEIGVLQPIKAVAALARAAGALVHCDAAQAAGKVKLDVQDLDVDYLSLSGHKLYGPQGIGALYCAAQAPALSPLMFGGGQQQAVRPGTEPTALIAGFGVAAEVAARTLAADAHHSARLVRRLLDALSRHQLRFAKTSDAPSLPGAVSLVLVNGDADDVVERLASQVCISTGSACNSGQVEPSHVLSAMGIGRDRARKTIRIYCGRYNTDAEIDLAATKIAAAAERSALASW